jgi:hypothetical protein
MFSKRVGEAQIKRPGNDLPGCFFYDHVTLADARSGPG